VTVLVGREPELAAVEELLGEAEPSLAALEIVGEPGIGKTTVWQEAVRRGEAHGLFVVTARPTESEARLSFAGLADMLEVVDDEIIALLPPPQRSAIDVALLRTNAVRAPSRRLVGTALLSILRELAGRGPVLLAVDDAQWLDPPTAAALEFSVRRLMQAPFRVVVSRRSDAARPGFVLAIDDTRLRRLPIGPLSVAALQRIIADRLGVSLPRPVLVRIAEASGGNAFYALEIARLLADGGAERSAPLPVPDDLRTLVTRRIASLPAPTRDALLAASALRRPRDGAVDTNALAPAERAGLVTVDANGQVSFTHPLFAAAVYRTASPAELRAVHGRLAEAVDDLEERSRHLALATTAPDPDAARVLDAAAQSARARGAPDSAAELTELALRLTADPTESDERRLALADHLHFAGDFRRASSLLEQLAASCRGDMRARALLALADIEYWRAGESVAVGHTEEALREAADPLLRARCQAAIAGWAGTSDLVRAAEAARAATELAAGREGDDPSLVALALGARVRADLFLGHGLDRAAAELALELEAFAPPPEVDTRIVFKLGQWLRYVDDFDGARRHLDLAENAALDEGDESSLANILLNQVLLECWSGNWELASELADRTHERFSLTGVEMSASSIWRAYVDAHLGRAVDARAAGRMDEPIVQMLWDRILGLAELAVGNYNAAAARLGSAVAARERIGFREPAIWRIEGDAVEAAVGAGDLESARSMLATLDAAAARSGIPWNRAVAARCHGLVLAAHGDLDGAVNALDRALTEHDACPMPFELARTLLVAGQVRRRLKQKRQARELLARAAELFDNLGARQWGDRAREAHARTATRSAPADLTPTELRIARLAASGLTNDAIAADVFVSRKTVEANLGRVYRKLGIKTRAQLSRALDAREPQAIP
jgi:DNA-binding CsgD family transcriptional regulator